MDNEGQSGLGPWCVGRRVVVRRLLRGVAGPSGGPAMSDLLGVMDAWEATTTTVRTEAGERVVVPRADIVAGKPVPPRRSVPLRVPVQVAESRAVGSWPPVESAHLGDWLLRASAGFSARANSALLVGDPGRPWGQALGEVQGFYADRGLPAWVQAMSGSQEHRRLLTSGWVSARPGEADTVFLLAGVDRALMVLQPVLPKPELDVVVEPVASPAWLANDARARANRDAALAVLQGPPRVAFASVIDASGVLLAKGRAALSEGSEGSQDTDLWLGITDLWVDPGHRRRGLACVVLESLLQWGATDGATTAYLQAREDNTAALALYERVGFVPHHSYAYLRPA